MQTPKFIARDCELSTIGVRADGRPLDSWQATRDILRHIDAAFEASGSRCWTPASTQSGSHSSGSSRSIDCLRHWAPNGQCYYADMSHVEVCTAETLSPRRFGAECLSTLVAAEAARRRAQERSSEGHRYHLSAQNADANDPGISFGTHLNVSTSVELWEELCGEGRRPAVLGFVSSAIAALVPFFGAGYVLPTEDGTLFSLSGRAHHLQHLRTLDTTRAFGRGLLNTRREFHGREQARLHLIGFDYCLAAAPLLASLLQCTLAAAEEGFCELILADPVRALRMWSWTLDPRTGQLEGQAKYSDGTRASLPEFVEELATRMLALVECGRISCAIAPEADVLLPQVIELAQRAARGELLSLAPHIDWAAKWLFLQEFAAEDGLALDAPELRLADHDFSSTNPETSPFWKLLEAGDIRPDFDQRELLACFADGPSESRAWGRGRLVRRFAPRIRAMDWSWLEFRSEDDPWGERLRLDSPGLDSLCEASFGERLARASCVEELEALQPPGLSSRSDPLIELPARWSQGWHS